MVSASALTQAEQLQSPLTKAAARCVLVLFGASGDLTKRKLVPALFNLAKANLLPDNFAILGVAFDDLTQDADGVTATLRTRWLISAMQAGNADESASKRRVIVSCRRSASPTTSKSAHRRVREP